MHPRLSMLHALALIAVLIVASLSPALAAEADWRRAWSAGGGALGFDWDNDAFLPSADGDGRYTNGGRLTLRFASPDRYAGVGADGGPTLRRHVYGVRLGQRIYTPHDVSLPPEAIAPDDRPYAGHLFLGLLRETFWSDGAGGRWLRLGIDLGCIGPCSGAAHTQRVVHRWVGAAEPRGWPKQIRNEVTVQLRAEYSPGRAVLAQRRAFAADFAPYVTAQLGNAFTHVGVGATLRVGRFNAPFDGSLLLAPARQGARAEAGARVVASELYAFARFESRLVGYNATLQGGWFGDSPHTVDAAPFVLETEIGLAWATRKWAIGYAIVTRSSEIAGRGHDLGRHRWGRVSLGWQFD